MTPIETPYTNALFCKAGCEDLPGTHYIYEGEDAPGEVGIETVWQLTEEELEIVKESGRIYLYTVGSTIQPLFLSVRCELDVKPPSQGGVTLHESPPLAF